MALMLPAFLLLPSCATDPDIDPQSTGPTSQSRQTPWNSPISGQGGGAMGALPKQPRR